MAPLSNQLSGNLFTALQQSQVTGALPPYARIAANQYGPSFRRIAKGSLVSFSYAFHKPGHDPTPLVIISDVMTNYIRGVNLHYLTYSDIVRLLRPNCSNPAFSYYNIKGNSYVGGAEPNTFCRAFRQYKRMGIRQIKSLDCSFLIKVLNSVRSIDPAEVEQIRRAVRDQINRTVNQPAQATVSKP